MRTYFVRYSSSFGKKRQRIYKLRNAGQTASVYVILHGGANFSYSNNLFSTRWLAKSSNRNFVHHKRAHHLRCALRQFILEKLCLCVTCVNLLSWNFHKILTTGIRLAVPVQPFGKSNSVVCLKEANYFRVFRIVQILSNSHIATLQGKLETRNAKQNLCKN